MLPYYNGCDVRIKWPKFFIKEEISTIFDHAVSCGYDVNVCESKSRLYGTGIFKYDKSPKINEYTNVADFVAEGKFSDNSLSFVGTIDYHYAIDDLNTSLEAVDEGHRILGVLFEKYLTNDFLKEFDYVFCFSDHGHILASEGYVWSDRIKLLGNERTQILMYYRKKADNALVKDNRLASITDLYATLEELLGLDDYREGYSFLKSKERDYVHIEDHKDFSVNPNVIIEQWRLISEDIDIRTDVRKTIDAQGNTCDIEPFKEIFSKLSPKYLEYSKEIAVNDFYKKIDYDKEHYFIGENRKKKIVGNPQISVKRKFVNFLRKIAYMIDI